MKNATFAQWFCLIIASASLISLIVIFFALLHHPEVLKDSTATALLSVIITAVVSTLATSYRYITGSSSSSQSKDLATAASTDKMIDAIANSTPTKP